MQIDYKASPIKDVVYFIGVCDSLKAPALLRGKVLRVEAMVVPTSNIPVTTTDTLSVRYVVLTDDKKNVVLENPVVWDGTTGSRADLFVATFEVDATAFQTNDQEARTAAIVELGARAEEKYAV